MAVSNVQNLLSEQSGKRFFGHKNRASAYSEVIESLTGRSAKDFLLTQLISEEKFWTVNEDALIQFKQDRDKQFQTQISELNSTISLLRQELEQTKQSSAQEIEQLRKELHRLGAGNEHDFKGRKEILDVKVANDKQATVFVQYLQKSHTSNGERDTFRKEQSEIELNIIDNCIEHLRRIFDELPRTGLTSIQTAGIDLNPCLSICLDARVRLSYFLDETKFITFLRGHVSQIENVLNLFNSRYANQSGKHLIIPLTAYEKRLISHNPKASDSYLSCYERPSEIQQRALTGQILNPNPAIFSGSCFQNFPSYLLFTQPEEAIRIMMITSHPVNNIICVPSRSGERSPDSSVFYALEKINGKIRTWKPDFHASQISFMFQHQYIQQASQYFRRFYRDVFRNNKYIANFEKILDEKSERWKQMKILFENIKIVSEDYLLGKLVRSVLFAHASHFPEPETDVMLTILEPISVQQEFRKVQERWKKHLPASEEEPEEWLSHCFDSYKAWSPEQTIKQYQQRWSALFQSDKFRA